MSLCLCGALFLLGAPARAQQLDASCTVTVNGQTVQVNPDGSFGISNIASADLFGPGGPGTAPDFVGDDAVRVVGTCTSGGQPVYVVSECFRINRGQTFQVGALTFTNVPPQTVASIAAAPGAPTLTALNQQTPINVTGFFTDGASGPLDPVLYCPATFRTSNPNIVSVAPDPSNSQMGMATAKGPGTARITVTVEGGTAVTTITVSLGDPLTTVSGIVQTEAGEPVNGATIKLFVNGMVIGGMGTSGGPGLATGQFSVAGVASLMGPISAYAEATIAGQLRSGISLLKPPVPGGFTDAGLVTLDDRILWITNANGAWHTGSNWISSFPPMPLQIAVIDVPAVITVTHSSGTNTVRGLQSQENFSLTGGTFSLSQASFVNGLFTHSNGTLGGAGTLTLNGPAVWSNGTMSGGGTTLLNGGLTIDGMFTKSLSNRTLTNANNGTIAFASSTLAAGSGSIINNEIGSTFDLQADVSVLSGGGTATFNNAGTLRKSAGSGTSTISITTNNSGSVEVETGTLQLGGGTSSGTFAAGAGATLDWISASGTQTITGEVIVPAGATLRFSGGTVNLNGDTDVTGQMVATGGAVSFNPVASAGVAASSLSMSAGGILNFAGPARVSGAYTHSNGTLGGAGTLTVDGLYTWTSGTMSGGGTTLLNGGMTLNQGALSNRTLTNANSGTIAFVSNVLSAGSGSVINNLIGSTIDFQADGTAIGTGGGPSSLISNAGTVRKSAGSGTSSISNNVNNSGTIAAQSGTLQFTGFFSLTQTAGSTVLEGGSITVGVGFAFLINGGTIGLGVGTPSGTITGNVTLGNSAASTIPRPGAAGVLTVAGTYTQNAGTLVIELGGLVQDTEYDRLAVVGNATLGGTLELTLINGFVPSIGDMFQVLTATGSRSGTFSAVNPTNFPPGLSASVTYTSNAATVTIVAE